ncbi:MAG: hypothetical protein EVA29_02645 [Candidatus Actinomarinales bacterium]|nr:MAG: hypothetical protein EVA29_02645 [Candidatus Actinomarinales bacterium]
MIRNWKENTVYISFMQITLLVVNFFLITIISREYGAAIYGEYASSKSLSVLIGTASVLSLALVTTKVRAQNLDYSQSVFSNSYFLVLRNLILSLVLLFPISYLLGRNYLWTSIFLVGYIFNEMIHIALAYYQAKGNFVISSKQILIRTVFYGTGAWFIVINGLSILWVIIFQTLMFFIFFLVAHFYIPKTELIYDSENNEETRSELTKSGKKMVTTTFSAVLISELDIVLLGLFYSGPVLGVLALSRRLLEALFQFVGASLDMIFPQLSKAQNKKEVSGLRVKLRKVFIFSFSIPILFYLFKDVAQGIFTNILGNEFNELANITSSILFCLPLMIWSRINIIYSRALNFELNITKTISIGAISSYLIYYLMHEIGYNPAVLSIIFSQVLIAILTTYSFKKSYA